MSGRQTKTIYMASQEYNFDDSTTNLPSGSWFSDRRPYDMTMNFSSEHQYDKKCTFKTLIGDKSFSTTTPGMTTVSDPGDMRFENKGNFLKTSHSSDINYSRMKFWNHANPYKNLMGIGGGFGDGRDSSLRSFYHPNVFGITFTWRRSESHWAKAYCGCQMFGLNYYNPDLNIWRTVRFQNKNKRDSGNYKYFMSDDGDFWEWQGGDWAWLDGGEHDRTWNPVRATLSPEARKKIQEEKWVWGGVWFELTSTTGKNVNKWRVLDVSDVQPIYGPYQKPNDGIKPRLIVPARVNVTQSDIKNMTLLNA